MRVQIVARKLRCDEATTDYIRRRVHFALGRFATAIRGVQVHVTDENGPRGGEDKRCRVLVSRQGGERLVVEGRGMSLQEVVDQSLRRASHSLSRTLERRRLRLDLGRNLWPPVPNS
jgi:putative sigma-54 modulation protein